MKREDLTGRVFGRLTVLAYSHTQAHPPPTGDKIMTYSMQDFDKQATDSGTVFKFRVPGDFVPRLHAYARSKGLSSSALVRMLILAELDRASHSSNTEPST